MKQLSSVVKWPRGAAAPHGGPKQPAHAPYAGELPAPGWGVPRSRGLVSGQWFCERIPMLPCEAMLLLALLLLPVVRRCSRSCTL